VTGQIGETTTKSLKKRLFTLYSKNAIRQPKSNEILILAPILSPIGSVKREREGTEYAFLGRARLKPPEEKLRALKRELKRGKRESDILKKAVAIFSTDRDRYSDS